jgi:opacity protein-like surface antigen
MKKCSILAPLLLGFVTASVQAGQEVYKQAAPPPPPPLYGVGFYGAIDGGANVYQNFGGSDFPSRLTDRFFESELSLDVSQEHDVGGFGGIKLGYVFGTGLVRPTVEGDFFYNGFNFGGDFTLRDPVGDVLVQDNVSRWVNSGAFMVNFILRFAPGNQRFQPYVGAGVGAYYAQADGFEFQNVPFVGTVNTGSLSYADLAWQVVAGADYYWTPKFSTFIEYHYLDYTTTFANTHVRTFTRRNGAEIDVSGVNFGDLGQHLVGAGVRFHF